MGLIIRKLDQSDYLLEAVKRLRDVDDHLPPAEALSDADNLRMTEAALSCGLYFRPSKPLAVISGAGIAGLAASFELRARGFNVMIVEKRTRFSRDNVINLNVEVQAFLKRFNLLEKFESCVAARIKEHRYVVIDKAKSAGQLPPSDVSQLELDESVSFEPRNFNKLFDKDGVYSVQIMALQTFLAENALEAGVNIFGDANVRILPDKQTGGVSKAEITFGRVLKPDLFVIAEGAHSTTARELGMTTNEVINACTGENWIFGNMSYSGSETFVVSLIDGSKKTLRIANVIFNAMSHVINIAVNSEREVPLDMIREQILETARQVFTQKAFPLEEMPRELVSTVLKPVSVTNRTCYPFSRGNVFIIGDSAGTSSPLAGLGGTLALTLVPRTVRQLGNDYLNQSPDTHRNFEEFSEGYTTTWFKKSDIVKHFCINITSQNQSAAKG